MVFTLAKARDILSIYSKLVQVLYPRKSSGREVLRLAMNSFFTPPATIHRDKTETGIYGARCCFVLC
jgi:hypothetical protein